MGTLRGPDNHFRYHVIKLLVKENIQTLLLAIERKGDYFQVKYPEPYV